MSFKLENHLDCNEYINIDQLFDLLLNESFIEERNNGDITVSNVPFIININLDNPDDIGIIGIIEGVNYNIIDRSDDGIDEIDYSLDQDKLMETLEESVKDVLVFPLLNDNTKGYLLLPKLSSEDNGWRIIYLDNGSISIHEKWK